MLEMVCVWRVSYRSAGRLWSAGALGVDSTLVERVPKGAFVKRRGGMTHVCSQGVSHQKRKMRGGGGENGTCNEQEAAAGGLGYVPGVACCGMSTRRCARVGAKRAALTGGGCGRRGATVGECDRCFDLPVEWGLREVIPTLSRYLSLLHRPKGLASNNVGPFL